MAFGYTKIISGCYKGHRLKVPSGESEGKYIVRPTLTRLRKRLFDIIGSRISYAERAGMIFADIFAGSGAIGLEALSLGFGSSIFIENHRQNLSVLKANIEIGAGRGKIIAADAFVPPMALEAVDILFFDPPYDIESSRWQDLLSIYERQGWVKKDSLIIMQYASGSRPCIEQDYDNRVIGKSSFGFIFA